MTRSARAVLSPVESRRRVIGEIHDLGVGRGLEVGPLDSPLVTRDMGEVHYADIMSREQLIETYVGHPLDFGSIPEIDFPLQRADGSAVPLGDAARASAPYAWVVASHVVEHVPDLIGWLGEVASLLEDRGTLVLVVPDRRYSFDFRRPGCTVGQVLVAHEHADPRPSIGAVFDHYRYATDVPAHEAWAGDFPERAARTHRPEVLDAQLAAWRAGRYIDAHVWPVTPGEFAYILGDLARLGKHDFVLRELRTTQRGQLEFFVVLERMPRPSAASGDRSPQVASFACAGDLLEQEDEVGRARRLAEVQERRIRIYRRRIRKLRRQRDTAQRRVARLERRHEHSVRALEAIRSSWTWRLARALGAPMRRVRRERSAIQGERSGERRSFTDARTP